MSDNKINIKMTSELILRYMLQGFAIAFAAYYVPVMYKTSLRKPTFREIMMIAITAAFTMFILDMFIPPVGFGAKLGAGFTIGKRLITKV